MGAQKKKKKNTLVTLVGSLVAGLVGRWTKQTYVRAPPNMTHHFHQHDATTADANTSTDTNLSKSGRKVLPNQLGRYNPISFCFCFFFCNKLSAVGWQSSYSHRLAYPFRR